MTKSIAVSRKYNPNYFSVSEFAEIAAYLFDGERDILESDPIECTKVTYLNNPNYYAYVYILPGRGNLELFDKPLIVGDAFDPYNDRHLDELKSKPQFNLLTSTTATHSPRTKGYDLIFIDFSQGGGDLLINAGINLKVVELIASRTTSEIIVGGPSMSGVLARIALLYGLPENNTKNRMLTESVKGYVSIDSPHLGASIAPSLQKQIYNLTTDIVLSLGVDVGSLFDEKIRLSAPINNWNRVSVPGTVQMLYGKFYLPQDYEEEKARLKTDLLVYQLNYQNTLLNNNLTFNTCNAGCNPGDPLNPQDQLNYTNCLSSCLNEKASADLIARNNMNTLIANRIISWKNYVSKNSYVSCEGHDEFYSFINSMGNFRKDVVSVGIAYSDFYAPHGENFNRGNKYEAAIIKPPSPNQFKVYAGGTASDPERFELYPGSTGEWYWQYYKNGFVTNPAPASYMTLKNLGTSELFKGTFIPVNSALALSAKLDIYDKENQNEETLENNSPFDKVLFMSDRESNGYYEETSNENDNKRFQHIVFDMHLMEKITEGLEYIENYSENDMTAILNILLLD